MTMPEGSFQLTMFSYLVLVPAAIMCFLPMRHQFRFDKWFSFITMAIVLVMVIVAASIIEMRLNPDYNGLFLPMLFVCFIFYHLLVKVPLAKSLAIFMFVTTLLAFVTNISNGFDMRLNLSSSMQSYTLDSLTLQLMLVVITGIFFAYPLTVTGAWLVDNLDVRGVWYLTSLISATFLVFNLLLYPRQSSLFSIREVADFYWGALIVMAILYLLLVIIFYYIVHGILDIANARSRNRIYEMEESQFLKQQAYMQESQEVRHDFKHAIRTLNEMAQNKDYDGLTKFITEYANAMPQNDIVRYSNNNAVNAMMNFYAESAKRADIDIDWITAIPEKMPLSDIELCNIIGNILENAIMACINMTEGERWIQLTAEAPNSSQFLIVATNSFNGKVRKRRGEYLSTNRNSNGIGLSSIKRIAQQHGGSAEFSHEGNEFYSNVIIPLEQ